MSARNWGKLQDGLAASYDQKWAAGSSQYGQLSPIDHRANAIVSSVHIVGQLVGASGFDFPKVYARWRVIAGAAHVPSDESGGSSDGKPDYLNPDGGEDLLDDGCVSGSGWLREEGAWQGETHVCSCCASEDVSAVWNHPIDVHYSLKVPPLQFSSSSLHKEPNTAKGLAAGAPRLFVEVWGEDELGRREVLSYGTSSIPMASGVHEVEIHTWAPAGARSSLIETAFLGGRPFLAHDSVVWFTPHRAALAKETTLLAATGKGKGGRTGMQAGGGGNLPNSSGGGNQALQMTCAGSVKASVMVIARKLAPTADDYKGLEEGGAGGSVAGSHVD